MDVPSKNKLSLQIDLSKFEKATEDEKRQQDVMGESTTFFNRFKNQQGNAMEISDSDKRDFAAQMVIVAMLYLCGEKDREMVYNYIKNEHILELIKGCIREGLVF